MKQGVIHRIPRPFEGLNRARQAEEIAGGINQPKALKMLKALVSFETTP